MAYNEVEKPIIEPVAPEAPVVSPTTPPPITTGPPPITQSAPAPIIANNIPASAIYSPTNIQQIDLPSNSSASNMKLSDLEKRLAKANSTAELNQIGIMNQTKAMGVLTGEAAHQSRLDTARLNAFTGLYNARLAEQTRKDTEKQDFIDQYGADPSQRPKGMSKREFAQALTEGKFSNLLTTEEKARRAALVKSSAGNKGDVSSASTVAASTALQQAKGPDNYTNPYEYIKQRDLFIANTPGATYDTFDSQFSGMLNPRDYQTVGFNPAQIEALKGKGDAETSPEKATQQLDLLDSALNTADDYYGASGRSGLRKTFESWFVGSTDYTNLQAAADTIKTNILTLSTDPNIKKFFGPQMSEADVRMMTSAGTMLNPETQSPAEFKKALEQAQDMVRRARKAVNDGAKQEQIVNQPDTFTAPKPFNFNGKDYPAGTKLRRGSDGDYYPL